MRRMLLVISAALVMAAMLVATAVPVFAEPSQQACVGTATSGQASTEGQGFGEPVSQLKGGNAANTTGYREANCPTPPA